MFRKAVQKLKEFFNDFPYGPFMPRTEVREALEKKGYTFERVNTFSEGAIFSYEVYTPDGDCLSHKDGTLDAYLEDYEQAERNYKATQKKTTNNNGPKPPAPK